MKIAHFDTDDLQNPLRGGQPVRTYQINQRLSGRHHIDVFTATYKGSRKKTERANINYTTLGFGVPRFGLSHHLSFLAAMGPASRRTNPDLIVEEFTPPLGFCLLPLWSRAPVVSIVQWFFFKDWEERYRLPFERIMRMVPRHFPYRNFIVQTRRMGQYFSELVPGAQIHRVPCGIDTEALFGQSSAGSYAMFLGRLDLRQKGIDSLLQIWEELFRRGIEIPLRIVGEGPGRARIEDHIDRSGMTGLITMTGRREGLEKLDLLRHCRFLVMPSREETFGLTALEAMAASKPVLAFDIDNLNEVVRPEWGVLIASGDMEGFGRAVLALWNAPEHCMELGSKGYEAAVEYSWDRLAEQQEAIYMNIVSKGNYQ